MEHHDWQSPVRNRRQPSVKAPPLLTMSRWLMATQRQTLQPLSVARSAVHQSTIRASFPLRGTFLAVCAVTQSPHARVSTRIACSHRAFATSSKMIVRQIPLNSADESSSTLFLSPHQSTYLSTYLSPYSYLPFSLPPSFSLFAIARR